MGRRALIKWSLAAGAALGVPRWKVFEILEMSGGRALAQDAVCSPSNRSVHFVGGRGGCAWFNLLWPHNDVAAARNDTFSWHAIGQEQMFDGTHNPLTVGPDTPWLDLPPNRQITAMVAGTNETHTRTPQSNTSVGNNVGLFAACAAIQTANPTLTPVIAIDDVPYRNADGAPRVARVGSADDIVALFNAAASRAGGLLADPDNAELFAASYSAWLSLRSVAGLSTTRASVASATTGARLLGTNLADALTPTADDLMRYGITATSRTENEEIAKALIVTAKAFKHGLTSSVIIPAFRDDPHGAFADMGNLQNTLSAFQQSLNAFYQDLAAEDDPVCGGTRIADNMVISFHGDTPKDPLRRNNWPDGTPQNSNWMYVLGAGKLKTGWLGGVQRDGTVIGWNPTTGENDPNASSADTAAPASAAVLYAVARGDIRRVADFYRGTDIGGIITDPTV